MRGDPQAASARLPATVPTRSWAAWLEETRERRRRRREERLEVMVRLQAEERRARQTGRYPAPRRLL
jgi:hypothetical protein